MTQDVLERALASPVTFLPLPSNAWLSSLRQRFYVLKRIWSPWLGASFVVCDSLPLLHPMCGIQHISYADPTISDSFRLATASISLPIIISHLDQWPKGPTSFARHHHYCSSCLTGSLGSLLASHSLPHIQPSFENHNANGIGTAVEG